MLQVAVLAVLRLIGEVEGLQALRERVGGVRMADVVGS